MTELAKTPKKANPVGRPPKPKPRGRPPKPKPRGRPPKSTTRQPKSTITVAPTPVVEDAEDINDTFDPMEHVAQELDHHDVDDIVPMAQIIASQPSQRQFSSDIPIIEVDEAEEHQPKETDRGRKPNSNYISYQEASALCRREMIPSRSKYAEWWERNKPKALPKYPNRVYKEWVSWNAFLGTDNKFNQKVGTKWRPITEAVVFVNALKLKSMKEWLDWCRIPLNLPDDIPARPDLVYNNWRSWNHWLGNTPADAIKVQQERALSQVFYIVQEKDFPSNVYTVGIDTVGLTSMKERWMRERFEIVRMYWYDPEQADAINQIITNLSRSYMGSDKQRLAVNVWEMVWQLSIVMREILRA